MGSERDDSFPSSSLRPPEHALLTSVLSLVRTGYYIGYSSSRARGNCSCGLALCRNQPFDNEWTVLWLPHSARAGSYEKAGIQFGQPKQQMLAVGTATPLTHTMHSDTTDTTPLRGYRGWYRRGTWWFGVVSYSRARRDNHPIPRGLTWMHGRARTCTTQMHEKCKFGVCAPTHMQRQGAPGCEQDVGHCKYLRSDGLFSIDLQRSATSHSSATVQGGCFNNPQYRALPAGYYICTASTGLSRGAASIIHSIGHCLQATAYVQHLQYCPGGLLQ